MAKYSIDSTTLTGIGDAIRAKEGSTGTIPVTEIASRIQAIETGKDVSAVTATAADVVKPKVFVDAQGNQVTGILEPVIQYEGEFVVSYDADWNTYVDCGFKPDAVMLLGFLDEYNGKVLQTTAAVIFSGITPGAVPRVYGYADLNSDPDSDIWFSPSISQTSSGFVLQNFGGWDSDDNWVSLAGQTWRYIAIKYTESIPAEFDTSVITATPADVVYPKVFIDKDGVTRSGTLRVQTYYYGADEPSADLGVDGDIYFVMG